MDATNRIGMVLSFSAGAKEDVEKVPGRKHEVFMARAEREVQAGW